MSSSQSIFLFCGRYTATDAIIVDNTNETVLNEYAASCEKSLSIENPSKNKVEK